MNRELQIRCVLTVALAMTITALLVRPPCAIAQSASGESKAERAPAAMHRAARAGDAGGLRSQLQAGADVDARDPRGRTPLMDAASAGQGEVIRLLLAAGANVNARAHDNRTPLIEAAAAGQLEGARLLIRAGAELNLPERGWGTPLETAERAGHNDIAKLLRAAGARSSGHSPGDTVCVRPWGGEGYCGIVESVNKNQYRIRVSQIVGCKDGCAARAECSAGRAVGGDGGIAIGAMVDTVSSCLTHTGVTP